MRKVVFQMYIFFRNYELKINIFWILSTICTLTIPFVLYDIARMNAQPFLFTIGSVNFVYQLEIKKIIQFYKA